MPIIKSAKKRVKITEKKTLRNRMNKSALRTAIKRYEKTIATGEVEAAKNELNRVVSIIDKSVKKGILHKNNAARKKARMTRLFNELSVNA